MLVSRPTKGSYVACASGGALGRRLNDKGSRSDGSRMCAIWPDQRTFEWLHRSLPEVPFSVALMKACIILPCLRQMPN